MATLKKALEWLKTDGHWKIVGYALLVGILLLFWNDYRDTKKALKSVEAQNGVLSVQFGKLADAYLGQGALIQSNHQATQEAVAAQGKQLTEAMKQQGAMVQAIFTAQGKIIAEVLHGKPTTGVTPTATGGFSDAKMVQTRSEGRPPLTSVTLNYDPTNADPMGRLSGTWTNNTEVFHSSVIEWKNKGDKSLVGTFKLAREVFDANGKLVGQEEVPLTNAKASFDIKSLPLASPRRWAAHLGPVYSYKDGRMTPGGGVSYRPTTNTGLLVGVTKDNCFLWGSWSFK